MFPAAVVAATKLLPQHLHVSGVGFAAAFGATGACVLPFAVGAIAQAKGVEVLMPCVLAFLVASMVVWGFLPGLKKEKREAEGRSGLGRRAESARQESRGHGLRELLRLRKRLT